MIDYFIKKPVLSRAEGQGGALQDKILDWLLIIAITLAVAALINVLFSFTVLHDNYIFVRLIIGGIRPSDIPTQTPAKPSLDYRSDRIFFGYRSNHTSVESY
jgi:hypothetical protein